MLKPFNGGLVQPLVKRIPGVGYAHPTKPCRWRGKWLHHGGDDCVLLFSLQKKPSEREFFIPARTDLGVKLLNHYIYIIPSHRVTHCLDHVFPISLIYDTTGWKSGYHWSREPYLH